MMIELRSPLRWLRLGAAAAAMLLAAVTDLSAASHSSEGFSVFVIAASFHQALFALGISLPRHDYNSRIQPALAIALATVSFVITVIAAFSQIHTATWGVTEVAGLLLVIYGTARRGAPRLAYLALGACGFALISQPLRFGYQPAATIIGLLQIITAGAVVAIAGYLRFLQITRERQLSAVRAEQRTEFARDLHDFVAHHVTGIVVQAQGARFIAEQDPKRVIAALDQIERAGTETMTAMRRMVGMLREAGANAPLAPLGRVADLSTLLDGFTSAGGPIARLAVDGGLYGLPVDVDTSAYRVVMEALTNIRQHAHAAREVEVSLRRTPDWLLVRILNDGPFPRRHGVAPDRQGYGLAGLRERVGALGGWVRAGPGIRGGWQVDAALPLRSGIAPINQGVRL